MDFYAFLDEPDEELGHKALQLYGICFCEECKKKSKKTPKKWPFLCKLFNK